MFAQVNNVRLYYEVHGPETGIPIVLIHGFPLSARQWDDLIPILLPGSNSIHNHVQHNNYRVIVPDMRGHGKSESTNTATMADYAQDLNALLLHLDVRRAVLVGMSFGGYVCFEFWRRYSSTVCGLALIDTRAIPDYDWHARKRYKAAEMILSEQSAVSISHEESVASLCGKGVDPMLVCRASEIIAGSPYVGVAAGMIAVADRPDSRQILKDINVPTLIMVGEEDTLTPIDLHEEMHAGIKDSKLVIVPQTGHMMAMERPDVVALELIELISKVQR